MIYFDFYGLPETFTPDPAALQATYYRLSREYHPDFHATKSPAEQAEALRLSTLNTDAYRTLSDPDARMAYVLREHGRLDEGAGKEPLPPDFLMDVMDLNEQLMDAESGDQPALTKLNAELTNLSDALDAGIAPLLAGYEGLPADHRPAALGQIRTYYLKKRYLLRLQTQAATFAARS